jgi:hypothetical protein
MIPIAQLALQDPGLALGELHKPLKLKLGFNLNPARARAFDASKRAPHARNWCILVFRQTLTFS